MMCSCHVTELGDIGFYLSEDGEETRLIWWCTDVRIYSATGRSELDVDNHLAKHRSCPRSIGLSGYWAELRQIAEPGNGVSCQPRASDLRDLGKGPPVTPRRDTPPVVRRDRCMDVTARECRTAYTSRTRWRILWRPPLMYCLYSDF